MILRKEGYATEFPRIKRVCLTKESVKLLPPVLWEDSERQEFAKGNTVFGRKPVETMHYSSRLVNFKRIDVSNSKVAPLERYRRRDRSWVVFFLFSGSSLTRCCRTGLTRQIRAGSQASGGEGEQLCQGSPDLWGFFFHSMFEGK